MRNNSLQFRHLFKILKKTIYPSKKKKNRKKNAHSRIFLYFGVRSNTLFLSLIRSCRPVIHQFKAVYSTDSIQIGISNQSLNKIGVVGWFVVLGLMAL